MSQATPGNQTDAPARVCDDRVAKLCGGDVELGAFIQGMNRPGGTSREAAQAILAEIRGAASPDSCRAAANPSYAHWYAKAMGPTLWSGGSDGYYYGAPDFDDNSGFRACGYNPQDWSRKYLGSNGGCVYIDLNHPEICLPEVLSAADHAAASRALLLIVREALVAANARLPLDQRIQVLVNNSDGKGNSYGSHFDILVTRRCFENIFHRKLHHLLYLASYLTSSIVFTGAGKVASENHRPQVDYQIGQRCDFYQTLTGVQTTFNRPIVNSRDESLCGSGARCADQQTLDHRMARLHVIFFDNTLCHVSSFLKAGVTQLVLAMIEQEWVVPGLILDNPLKALLRWSHDPDLRAKARLVSGRDYTAVEVQSAIHEQARRFVAAGRAEGIVPAAEEILAAWGQTLEELRKWDVGALVGKLDWVLKRSILEQAIRTRDLRWDSPEIKYLDHLYSSLDPAEGLYWAMERANVVRKVVSDGRIEHFVHEPPEDTRAWLRAQILRRVGAESIEDVDWDTIRFKFARRSDGRWTSYSYFELPMHDPLGFTKARCQRVLDESGSFEGALRSLGMRETTWSGQPIDDGRKAETSIVHVRQRPRETTGDDQVVAIRDVSTTGLRDDAGDDNHGTRSSNQFHD